MKTSSTSSTSRPQWLRFAIAACGAMLIAACGGGGSGGGGSLGAAGLAGADGGASAKEAAQKQAAAKASPNPSSTGVALGNSEASTQTDTLVDASGHYINVNLFTANASVDVDRIRAWVKGRAGSGIAYKAAIYLDGGDGAPQLLAASGAKSALASGWLELPLANRVPVRQGGAYWLAIWSGDAASGIGAAGGVANGLRWMKLGFGNEWPAQIRTDGEGGLRYSIHALKADTTPPGEPPTNPPSNPARGWNITTANVGLAGVGLSCNQLPLYTGSLKPAAGTTISGMRITGPLDLSNGNILIEKSCIRPEQLGDHHGYIVTTTICAQDCNATPTGNVVIRDSEFDTEHLGTQAIAGSCAFLGVGTLERNYMHGMGSGICFFETGAVHNARAERNYVRGLRAWIDPGGDADKNSHNEAATVRDFRDAPGRTAVFLNNRLDCSTASDTGALFLQPTWLPIHNVTIEGNLLEGGGYNLYLERTGNASYGNIRANDNRFRRTNDWYPVAVPSGPGFASWSDGYFYDASKPDAKGEVVLP